MIPYFELVSQREMLDSCMHILRTAIKIKPDFRKLLAKLVVPDDFIDWIAESRKCRYISIDSITGSNSLSYTRIPLVLYSKDHSKAIVFEMAQSRFNSFRLEFLESKEGQRMFKEDYDLLPDAEIILSSITFSDSEIINVSNYRGLSVLNDINSVIGDLELSDNTLDLLLLDFQDFLNRFSLEVNPIINENFDVLSYINDYSSWLDLQNRFHHFARTISRDCSVNSFLGIDPIDDDIVSIKNLPMGSLIINTSIGIIIYDILRHTLSLKKDFKVILFTPADIVLYSEILAFICPKL